MQQWPGLYFFSVIHGILLWQSGNTNPEWRCLSRHSDEARSKHLGRCLLQSKADAWTDGRENERWHLIEANVVCPLLPDSDKFLQLVVLDTRGARCTDYNAPHPHASTGALTDYTAGPPFQEQHGLSSGPRTPCHQRCPT